MPNKTISVPDDVVPIIDSLDMPFSTWVSDQLRAHAARTGQGFTQQLMADAVLAGPERPSEDERRAIAQRMARSAEW